MSRMIRVPVVLLCLLTSAVLTATEQSVYVVPVVTAHFNEHIYTTTLALRNDSQQDVTCESIYAVPNDPQGGTLRTTLTIPSGARPQVQEDVLMEAGAIGTIRLVCSAKLALAARIQVSTDGGATFDDGRTYTGLDEASAFRRLRTVTARSDLLVAEVTGKSVTFEAIVKNDAGVVIGHKTYEVPGFAQQIVNLSKLLRESATLRVELRVTGGEGALVAGEETRDPALLAMAVRMPAQSRRALEQDQWQEEAASQAASSGSNIAGQLLVSSFKAAPFQDPFTGLVLMRDRWYDRSTGTFLTPDPEGYADSSNPYTFCGGDPVNCSDPTGRAASLSNSGWIIATDNRNGGVMRRFSPEEIANDPTAVRAFLGRNADVRAADSDAMIVRAGQAASINNAEITRVARDVSTGLEDIARHGSSIYVSSIPGVGDAADAHQAWTGYDPIARQRLSKTERVITAIGAGLPVVTGKVLREALLESGKTALRQFDIDYYGTFSRNSARVGDQLEGHEMLQNLWLEVNQGVRRGSAPVSTMNPAVAVPRDIHTAIGREQRALGLFDRTKLAGMSAAENIDLNVLAMRRAGVPEHVVQTLKQEALKHASSLP